jgi:hypothetical protein
MAYNFKDYLIECLHEAPHAWRKGAIAMTVLINVALVGLVYLGWHLDAYPVSYFLIGTSAIALLDVLIIFPFKLWKANKAEIQRLNGNYSGARKRLWELREEGVKLRNDGILTRAAASWNEKFLKWHSEVLEQAAILSMNLRHSLDPIDKIAAENNEPFSLFAIKNDFMLQKNVSVMSEMLSRLYNYLNRTAEPR